MRYNKIIIGGIILFSSFASVSAGNVVYLDPDLSMLPYSQTDGTTGPDDYISDDTASTSQFCIEQGASFDSSTFSTGAINVAEYSVDTWTSSTSTTRADTITCFFPEVVNEGLNYNGTIGTGALLIASVNHGQIFLYRDNLYMLMVDFLVTILFLFLLWKFFLAVRMLVFNK